MGHILKKKFTQFFTNSEKAKIKKKDLNIFIKTFQIQYQFVRILWVWPMVVVFSMNNADKFAFFYSVKNIKPESTGKNIQDF